jgi:glycosyltransferase involved in cell wall biosynthesis
MKLSVITVNFNNKIGLEKTIKSAVSQDDHDFEWLIIDGGSSDGSKEVIKTYQTYFDYFVSEPDNGVYDAMNKGITAATGDYILFLNSGDTFYTPKAISIIIKHLDTTDFIICDYIKQTKSDTTLISQDKKEPRSYLINGMYCHQSVLHKRSLFDMLGLYDNTYKIAADYAFYLKGFFEMQASYSFIKTPLVMYDDSCGISDYNTSTENTYIEERKRAQKEIFVPELVEAFVDAQKQIKALKDIQSKYQGLLKSGWIQLALKIINFKTKLYTFKK